MSQSDESPKPSTYDGDYWIFAKNKTDQNNQEPDENCGKWMIFKPYHQIDEDWSVIKKATEEGKLGHSAKVSTRKPSKTPSLKVVIL